MSGLGMSIWKEAQEECREGYIREGEANGRAKGIIETGYRFGLSDTDILTQLQEMMEITVEQAKKYLDLFGKQLA